MRRTVRGEMAGTIPSATAWRARSSLDQCVMCSPLAIGSRQARATIWARCRGGNPLGAAGPDRRCEQSGQPLPLVAPAGPPDGGLVALDLRGDGAVMQPLGVGQDDAGTAHLEPGQGITPGDP